MVDFKKLLQNRRIVQGGAPATAPTEIKPLPRTFVALDFETTGYNPEKDRIIEIGAVRFTEGEPMAIFNTMVRQDTRQHPITPEIQKATGHSEADVQKGMDEENAIKVLMHFLIVDNPHLPFGENALIVGQNVLFDFSFFINTTERLGLEQPKHMLLDTLTIGRERWPYPHKLPDLCRYYNINQENWHSAYFDALATGQLLLAMHAEEVTNPVRYLARQQVMDYLNVIGFKRQYGEPEWYPHWVTLKPQGNIHTQHKQPGMSLKQVNTKPGTEAEEKEGGASNA